MYCLSVMWSFPILANIKVMWEFKKTPTFFPLKITVCLGVLERTVVFKSFSGDSAVHSGLRRSMCVQSVHCISASQIWGNPETLMSVPASIPRSSDLIGLGSGMDI